MKDKVLEQLKTQFRPEFLNRVDSLVVFRSLTGRGDPRDRGPAAGAGARAAARAADRLEITQEAKDHIIKLGYDVDYGARPLRRVIQNMVEDPLAEALLLGQLRARPDHRGRPVRRRRPDHRAGREKTPVEAGSRARGHGAAAEPLRLPVLRRDRPCAGKASAASCGALEHARRDRRPRHVARPRRAARARPVAAPAVAPLSEVATSTLPRLPRGHRRGRPRARRRARAGRARAARRRAGHRQVDARARDRRGRRRAAARGRLGGRVLYASGEESAAQLHLRADGSASSTARPASASRSSPRPRSMRILAAAERIGPAC